MVLSVTALDPNQEVTFKALFLNIVLWGEGKEEAYCSCLTVFHFTAFNDYPCGNNGDLLLLFSHLVMSDSL